MSISITKNKRVEVKDPYSALTHFIGAVLAILMVVPLIIRALVSPSTTRIVSLMIFIISMILLYLASTAYHTVDSTPKINKILKKIDHMCIFVLIAGTYTPICLIVLNGKIGFIMLITIWAIAVLGITFKALWVTCPKWISSVIYISMGWMCMLASSQIFNALEPVAFYLLLAGGIIYTIGGIIYALKLPIFNTKHSMFGSHEIFHVFVLAGSACHFILIYKFIAIMPIK